VSRKNQEKVQDGSFFRDVPTWARDNLVLKMLDDQGLHLEVVYDRKYLNGMSKKPVIVIRAKHWFNKV
jgi:hypothetical protein